MVRFEQLSDPTKHSRLILHTKPAYGARDAAHDRELGHPSRNTAAHSILQLHRTFGNRAVQRLLEQELGGRRGLLQTKLEISQPGDEHEREADRVAEQVAQMMDAPLLQAKCAACQAEGEEEKEKEKTPTSQLAVSVLPQSVQGGDDEFPDTSPDVSPDQGSDSDQSQKVVFRKEQCAAAPLVTQPVVARLASLEAGGEPLPAKTLQRMEQAFGRDFSAVRVHRDAAAREMSAQLRAHAFTHGSHVFFNAGMFDPEGPSGKRLLAHELTHVVQQGQAGESGSRGGVPATPVRKAGASIQRNAVWATGAVHEVNNLADSVMNGPPVGITFPMLNGNILHSGAEARAAMTAATLTFSPGASGGIDAKVDTVPTNTGSFDETVLAPGPWTVTVPKATVGANLGLAACTGGDDSTFRAIGDPSDTHMFQANRRHENHHANDHHTAFNGSIGAWDKKLKAAKTAGTAFHGATQADAEAALWTAMGGTPNDVSTAYWNACLAAGAAFHGTAAGGPVGAPTSPTANADCSTSSAKFHNPS